MYVGLLPEAEVDVRLKNAGFLLGGVCLRVEGEDALVVAAHQQDGRQVLGQGFQPGHVESAGHRTLPS